MSSADLSDKTFRFSDLALSDVGVGETVVYSKGSTEERGCLDVFVQHSRTKPDYSIGITELDEGRIEIETSKGSHVMFLHDTQGFGELFIGRKVLLDISGMSNTVWPALLRGIHDAGSKIRVVYVEPKNYTRHRSPIDHNTFDLSTSFGGLAPIPGFVKLSRVDEDQTVFVAFLGFEGNRPESLFASFEVSPKVIPVVGVPGFRIEFPAYTLSCNRRFLEQRPSSEIRFARASCPFEVIEILEEVRKDYPEYYMYLAPVGTKPHTLGAIMFALKHPDSTEVLYDHPGRKPGRTEGVGVIHVYEF